MQYPDNLRNIIENLYPIEYMSVGETKVDILFEQDISFSNQSSDSGTNIDIAGYISIISGSILILKEAYDLIKKIKNDYKATINPEDLLKEINSQPSISEDKKKELISKVLQLVSQHEE